MPTEMENGRDVHGGGVVISYKGEMQNMDKGSRVIHMFLFIAPVFC